MSTASKIRRRLHTALTAVTEMSAAIVHDAGVLQGETNARSRKIIVRKIQSARSATRQHLRHAATQARYSDDAAVIEAVEAIRQATEILFVGCKDGETSAALTRQIELIDATRHTIHSFRRGREHGDGSGSHLTTAPSPDGRSPVGATP